MNHLTGLTQVTQLAVHYVTHTCVHITLLLLETDSLQCTEQHEE
jgi:hypothetical protein